MTGLVSCPECQGSGRIYHGSFTFDPENVTDTECSECRGVGSIPPTQAAAINRRIDREYAKWGAL